MAVEAPKTAGAELKATHGLSRQAAETRSAMADLATALRSQSCDRMTLTPEASERKV